MKKHKQSNFSPVKSGINKGFSLIELLIVIAIIGVLTAFAYPSYQEYIMRAHRSDGQTALLDLACRMEQFYAEFHTYETATIAMGSAKDVLSQPRSIGHGYLLSIVNATPNTYQLQATPTGQQGKNDRKCQSLTVNHLGIKGIAPGPLGAPLGTNDECW